MNIPEATSHVNQLVPGAIDHVFVTCIFRSPATLVSALGAIGAVLTVGEDNLPIKETLRRDVSGRPLHPPSPNKRATPSGWANANMAALLEDLTEHGLALYEVRAFNHVVTNRRTNTQETQVKLRLRFTREPPPEQSAKFCRDFYAAMTAFFQNMAHAGLVTAWENKLSRFGTGGEELDPPMHHPLKGPAIRMTMLSIDIWSLEDRCPPQRDLRFTRDGQFCCVERASNQQKRRPAVIATRPAEETRTVEPTRASAVEAPEFTLPLCVRSVRDIVQAFRDRTSAHDDPFGLDEEICA